MYRWLVFCGCDVCPSCCVELLTFAYCCVQECDFCVVYLFHVGVKVFGWASSCDKDVVNESLPGMYVWFTHV